MAGWTSLPLHQRARREGVSTADALLVALYAIDTGRQAFDPNRVPHPFGIVIVAVSGLLARAIGGVQRKIGRHLRGGAFGRHPATVPQLCVAGLNGVSAALGPVDKVDSQIGFAVIQDCFLGGGFGTWGFVGRRVAAHWRAFAG